MQDLSDSSSFNCAHAHGAGFCQSRSPVSIETEDGNLMSLAQVFTFDDSRHLSMKKLLMRVSCLICILFLYRVGLYIAVLANAQNPTFFVVNDGSEVVLFRHYAYFKRVQAGFSSNSSKRSSARTPSPKDIT